MKQLRVLAPALVLCTFTLFVPDLQAQSKADSDGSKQAKVLLRASADQVDRLAIQYDLTLLKQFDQGGETVLLVGAADNMPAKQFSDLLASDEDVISAEAFELATLPSVEGDLASAPHESDVVADLLRIGTFASPCGDQAEVWSGYADQQAASLIRLHAAQAASPNCGASATVAIIDTAIDVEHPTLRDAIVPGVNFRASSSEATDSAGGLDQSVMAILELHSQEVVTGQGGIVMLDASVAPIVGPELASALEGQDIPPFFGHGTMVAGIVRLVAPGAKIMPLQVFDDQGFGDMFDVVRAIYHAVDNGADVINMSFSASSFSSELKHAMNYARSKGVVCVAAAGNHGERTQVYPAAFGSAIGVASTDQQEQLSAFSNYGSGLVSLAAPGVGLVSTFPNGHYAAGWGTSFSTPLVAGTLALIEALVPSESVASVQRKARALEKGSVPLKGLEGEIGSGRLDVAGTLIEAAQ